jgi:hypothetical protein
MEELPTLLLTAQLTVPLVNQMTDVPGKEFARQKISFSFNDKNRESRLKILI